MDCICIEFECVKKDEFYLENEVVDLFEDFWLVEVRLDEYSEKIREVESLIMEL